MCLPKCGEEAFRGDTRLKFAQNAVEHVSYSLYVSLQWIYYWEEYSGFTTIDIVKPKIVEFFINQEKKKERQKQQQEAVTRDVAM